MGILFSQGDMVTKQGDWDLDFHIKGFTTKLNTVKKKRVLNSLTPTLTKCFIAILI